LFYSVFARRSKRPTWQSFNLELKQRDYLAYAKAETRENEYFNIVLYNNNCQAERS